MIDGVLRFMEVRYSMFYALFALCAVLPVFRAVAAARGVNEADPWKTVVAVWGRRRVAAAAGVARRDGNRIG